MTDRVSISFLGPLAVSHRGASLEISRRQSRVLLGVLASAQGRWMTPDRLGEAMWGDQQPKSPRASLQVAIVRLRSAFDDLSNDIIESASNGYRLAPSVTSLAVDRWLELVVDARSRAAAGDAIRALECFHEARQLWRGTAYEGLDDIQVLRVEAERLRQGRVEAELDETQQLIDQHRWPDAVSLLATLAAEEPLREDIAAANLVALHFGGRSGDAVLHASQFRRNLSTELGLSPSAVFDDAERRVLTGQAPPPVARSQPLMRPSLIAMIVAHIDDAFDGSVAHLHLDCPPNFDVALLIEHLHRSFDADVRTRVSVARNSSGSVHSLRDAVDPSPYPGTLPGGQKSEHFVTLQRWNRAAGGDRLLVLVDAAEKLDAWSRELLDVVRSEPSAQRNLVIVTTQTYADGQPSRSEMVESGRLRPLTAAAAMPAVEWHEPDLDDLATQQLAAQLVERFDGAPLWIEHALSTPQGDGSRHSAQGASPDLSSPDVLLEELAPSCRQALAQAAVLSSEVDCALLAACLGCSTAAVLDQLGPAIRARHLVPHQLPGRWVFADNQLRVHMASAVSLHEAKTLHAAAAQWLHDQARALEAADHVLEAMPLVDPAFAHDVLVEGAHELQRTGAYQEAATQLELAATLTSDLAARTRCDFLRAGALEMVGLYGDANELLDSVIAFADENDDLGLIARSALAGTGQAGMVGGVANRRRRLSLARNRIAPGAPYADEVAIELALEKLTSRREVEPELFEHVRSVADDPSRPAYPTALRVVMVFEQIRHGASFDRAEHLVASLRSNTRTASIVDRGACLAAAIHVALECGRWDPAEDWIGEMQLLGDQSGNPRAIWQSRAFLTALTEAKGEHDRADDLASEALDIGRRLALDDAETTFGLHHLGRAYIGADLAAFRSVMDEGSARYDFPVLHALRGLAAADDGDLAAARGHLRAVTDRSYDQTEVFRLATIVVATLLAYRLDDTDTMRELEADLDVRKGRFVFVGYGGPCLGPVDWYRSLLPSDHDTVNQRLDDAKRLCERERARAWLAGPLRLTIRPG